MSAWAGSTGLVYPDCVHGGLDRPAAELINAVWFDVEAHQTKSTEDSRETPQRPEYELVQVAAVIEMGLGTPGRAEYMRCVLFCLCCSNCPENVWFCWCCSNVPCALLDGVDQPDFWHHAKVPSALFQP